MDDEDVVIEIPNDKSTINVKSGRHFLPIESLGSGVHEVFMLASDLILNDRRTILLEEPEVHLHPHLQRRLMKFIIEETEAQYFITTHSSSIIDTDGAHIFHIFGVNNDGYSQVSPLLTSQEKYKACHELGFRSSDLLQSNCVIWVEGPSDRIYLNHWINRIAPDLSEGINYSIIFYGGKVLSHFSADESELNDFVSILHICRHAAVIMDSDMKSSRDNLRPTKVRVMEELDRVSGFCWVTKGREIENYYSSEDRLDAIKSVYKTADRLTGANNRFGKPLEFLHQDGKEKKTGFDKVAIAKSLIVSADTILDAKIKASELVSFIRSAQ